MSVLPRPRAHQDPAARTCAISTSGSPQVCIRRFRRSRITAAAVSDDDRDAVEVDRHLAALGTVQEAAEPRPWPLRRPFGLSAAPILPEPLR